MAIILFCVTLYLFAILYLSFEIKGKFCLVRIPYLNRFTALKESLTSSNKFFEKK